MFGREIPIHVIDFEGAPSYGVVEYGVATLVGGKVTDTKTRICRALAPIDADDVAVHGLTYERTMAHAPFEDAYDEFVNLRRSGPLAAHNARYEARLVKMTWAIPPIVPAWDRVDPLAYGAKAIAGTAASGIAIGELFYSDAESAIWGPWVDSCALARKLAPGLSRYKLEVVVNELGLQNELDAIAIDRCPADRRMYHCALYDAIAAALILKKLVAESTSELAIERLFSVKE